MPGWLYRRFPAVLYPVESHHKRMVTMEAKVREKLLPPAVVIKSLSWKEVYEGRQMMIWKMRADDEKKLKCSVFRR